MPLLSPLLQHLPQIPSLRNVEHFVTWTSVIVLVHVLAKEGAGGLVKFVRCYV